ncbi:von Willebrand factor type A domain-containing protein [Prauserella marina]|uniref:von Willebrand factor type A domain-containing protein n=1 Tax=Prauserella marina TaxID=530584 RepID=A0A1G6KDT7_9PSEU|nr:VWA domain-containing protein [Prauserella marina]PWV84187.1 von Willebrand factor type A domain-containing protein [Prauserella marina]SDC28476.1 von Willebrand factor type A domain-containing protein [Prauserella marina]
MAALPALGALLTGLVVHDVPASAAVPGASPATSVVTVKTGGDRTGGDTVGGLAGVRLGLFATETSDSPVDPGWGLCTSDADGDCNFVVPDTATGGANNRARFYVKQVSAPPGWYVNPELRTGRGSGSQSEATSYQFQTPALEGGQTYSSAGEFMYSHDYSSRTASDGIWQTSRDNPPLPGNCGLDVALVLDLSASVGSSLPRLKASADTFADSLVGTPSRMSLFSFSGTSPSVGTQNHPELTSVSTQAGADEVKSTYQDWELGAGTNWDQGLYQVAQAAETYEVVVVLTDGNPTRYGERPHGDGSNTHFIDVENGIFSANAVKAKGSRVLAVGVGSGVEGVSSLNLAAISGPVGYDGTNLAEADYFQTQSYDNAGQVLHELVLAQCEHAVSVVKEIVPEGNTGENVTGSRPAEAGWRFDASSTTPGVGGLPASQSTTDDGTGSVSFELGYQAGQNSFDLTIDENQQPGHTLVTQGAKNAVCTNLADDSPVPVTNSGGTGFTFDADVNAVVSCTVYNRPAQRAEVTVDKEWVIDGEHFAEGEQPEGFEADLTLTGPAGADPTAQPWGEPREGYTVGDPVTIAETTSVADPGCRIVSARVSEADGEPADADLPHQATVDSPMSGFRVTNTVICGGAQLTLEKKVDNRHGGTAGPRDWTLVADGPTPVSGVSGSTEVTEVAVEPGTYTLAERDGPGGYTTSGWTCERDGAPVGVEQDSVTLDRGDAVTCTIVNADKETVPPPGPGPDHGQASGPLASTGVPMVSTLAAGALLLVAGLVLSLVARRHFRDAG